MFYRENGQFKTSYRADQQDLPDRAGPHGHPGAAGGGLCACAHAGHRLFLPRHPDPAGHHVAGSPGREHLVGLLRPDLALGSGPSWRGGLRCLTTSWPASRHATDSGADPGRPVRHLLRHPCSACPACASKGLYLAVATLAAQFFSDWMFLRIKWFTNNSALGSVSVNNLKCWACHRHAAVSKYLFCLGAAWWSWPCWPRTWCAAPSAASGWPSATWTWPPA